MPDPNGTAVIMKFADILDLEQYLLSLSISLHTNLFEIVSVQLTATATNRQCSIETVNKKNVRLQKNREFNKRKREEGSHSSKQARLQSAKEYKKRKQSMETNCERQLRLEKDRLYQKQKYVRSLSQPHFEITQQDYLSTFDHTENSGIEEQSWAKASMSKFHKSLHYVINQCTICHEAWPLKSKPRSPYVCSRCSRHKKSPKKISHENSMIPSSVPNELQNLTQTEEMLIACALPIMQVYIKPGGQ